MAPKSNTMRRVRVESGSGFMLSSGPKGSGTELVIKLLEVLKAIARGRDIRFLALFFIAAVLSMPRPNRLFRTLDRLGITSKYGNVVAPDGSRFRIDFRSLILIYEIYLLECYEFLDGFRIARDDIVIDVGSNIGLFTVKAARESGEGGLVVSIEPHPAALRLLRINVAKNGLNNVRPVGAALGAKIGEANLVFSRGSTVGTFYDS